MSASDPLEARPFVEGLSFGECPRWRDGRLWYSDFYQGTVSSAGVDGDVRVEVEVPTGPAGLGWLIEPFIINIPKETLDFTLQALRKAVLNHSR